MNVNIDHLTTDIIVSMFFFNNFKVGLANTVHQVILHVPLHVPNYCNRFNKLKTSESNK